MVSAQPGLPRLVMGLHAMIVGMAVGFEGLPHLGSVPHPACARTASSLVACATNGRQRMRSDQIGGGRRAAAGVERGVVSLAEPLLAQPLIPALALAPTPLDTRSLAPNMSATAAPPTASAAAASAASDADWCAALERLVLARREAQAGHSERAFACALDALSLVGRESAAEPPIASPAAAVGASAAAVGASAAAAVGASEVVAAAPKVARHRSQAVFECNRLLRALGDSRQLGLAKQLFDAMLGAKLTPSQVTYGTLIARAGRNGQLKLAVAFYRDMQRRGLSPDTQTYNSLINAFAKAGDATRYLTSPPRRPFLPYVAHPFSPYLRVFILFLEQSL